jgi:hypothetical protein
MKHGIVFISAVVFCVSLRCGAAYSQEENRNSFSSKFCTVFYDNEVDLKRVDRNIKLDFSNYYSPSSYKEDADLSTEAMISGKLDSIFNRAEKMLDMYPAKIHVAINIYKNQEDLDKVYEEFFNEPNKALSFYIYKTNTIYTIEPQLNENILAHEIAHCIIDHYFVILPPRKIQEMLSGYVDLHLKD